MSSASPQTRPSGVVPGATVAIRVLDECISSFLRDTRELPRAEGEARSVPWLAFPFSVPNLKPAPQAEAGDSQRAGRSWAYFSPPLVQEGDGGGSLTGIAVWLSESHGT